MIQKEKLEKLVQESKSGREVAKKTSYSHTTIQQAIKKHNIDTSHFIHGNTYKELIGKQFGILTVLEILKKKKSKRKWLLCVCECGNNKEIRADSIHKCYSCGCKSKGKPSMYGCNNPAWTGIEEIHGSYISDIKRNAKRRNREYELSKEYLWELFIKQNRKCALTGEELFFTKKHRDINFNASLDRIDSSKDYIEGNVQWVTKEVNMLKGSMDNDRFIEICQQISNNLQEAPGRL